MSQILTLNQSFMLTGLDTLTYTIPTSGVYSVAVQSTEIPPSGISFLVEQNGSTVYTSPTLSPTQSAIQFRIPFYFTAADAIQIAMSGSAIDSVINNVKTNLIIQQGQ